MTDMNIESGDETSKEEKLDETTSEVKEATEEVSNVEELNSKKEDSGEELSEESKEENELEALTKDRDKFKEQYYYLAAEFENAKKRFEREKTNLMKFGNERLLSS